MLLGGHEHEARELEGQKVCPVRTRCESARNLNEGPNKETSEVEGAPAPAIDKEIMNADAFNVDGYVWPRTRACLDDVAKSH